ncbi:hypothetical protein LIER_37763 [Lithospermum erythrorhizon]|uniref:Uncharacterized protein n=1 Tax=Lithospermum erythrorhizon TaxID=34254 RepID=A0AAV3PS64_LITER
MEDQKGGKAHPVPYPKPITNSRPVELLALPPVAQFIAPDDASHLGAFTFETSSSEDDEATTDPSVINASDFGSNHVSPGHARPHVLAPRQTCPKTYIHLNEYVF